MITADFRACFKNNLQMRTLKPTGAEALDLFTISARLKSCPDYEPFLRHALTLVSSRQQISADKRFQVAIQDPVHVAYFHLGAVVFYQAVRMQHVRPYLRAKIYIELSIFHLSGGFTLFFQLRLI